MGWAELVNGDLLNAAEAEGFEVMVTGDKNIAYQQNLSGRRMGLVVLSTNRWRYIRDEIPLVVEAVEQASRGSFEVVRFAAPLRRKRR